MGRLTKDPTVSGTDTKIARYTIAVDRRSKEKATDFISCVAFGKNAEFAENYLHQGTKISVIGRIQTGSYTNREGKKIYTTDVVIDEHEFCESLNHSDRVAYEPHREPQQGAVDTFPTNARSGASMDHINGFMEITDSESELPFT